MLKITKTVEYALISIKHIKNSSSDKLYSSKEIANQYNIPYELLSKILQKLCRLGYLKGIKGAYGGYTLSKSLDDIKLINFLEDIEGPIGLAECSIDSDCECNQINLCNIKSPIDKINDNIRAVLSQTTLNEITT
jgi:Rrf2 family protein